MVAWLDPFAEAWGRDRSALCRARVEETIAPELDDLGAAVVGSYLGSRGPAAYSDGGWWGGRGFWVGE